MADRPPIAAESGVDGIEQASPVLEDLADAVHRAFGARHADWDADR